MSELGTVADLQRVFDATPLRYRPEIAWNGGECSFAIANNELYLNLMVDGPGLITWYAVKAGAEYWRERITFDGETLPASLHSLLSEAVEHPGPLPHLVRHHEPAPGGSA